MADHADEFISRELLSSLLDALVRTAGKEEGEALNPAYPVSAPEALRRIGKEERPRLQAYFESLKSGDEAEPKRLARAVAHACEDLFAAMTSLQIRARELAQRSGVDAGAVLQALSKHPLVQKAVHDAMALVSKLHAL